VLVLGAEVSSFLDHSSLTVTTVYLRRLEGTRDEEWSREAKAIRVAPQVAMAWEEVSEGRTAEPMKTRS